MARLVIAFGGNALIREDERGTWPEQTVHASRRRARSRAWGAPTRWSSPTATARRSARWPLQQALGEPHAPALPLDVLDAMTQGEIGYLLQQALTAVDPSLPTATVLTRVLVAEDDPAFAAEPTKPIGAFFAEDEARRLARERGWHVAPDAGRGWRRMVPSPRPLRILEVDHVRRLAEAGVLVIAAGGGGIPVAWRDGQLVGLDAVIDKDRCAAELAVALEADLLVLITSVPRVEIGFGTPASRAALRLTRLRCAAPPRGGRVPAGQHGAQDRGRRALRERREGAP